MLTFKTVFQAIYFMVTDLATLLSSVHRPNARILRTLFPATFDSTLPFDALGLLHTGQITSSAEQHCHWYSVNNDCKMEVLTRNGSR